MVVALVACAILAYVLWTPPLRTGDGFEYFFQNQSLFNHLSPELRPRDAADFIDVQTRGNPDEPLPDDVHAGYFRAKNGKEYSYHFLAYPLAALPAKTVLHGFGLNEMRALELTNVAFFLLPLLLALRMGERVALFALCTLATPVVWYVKWSHPECMLYALFLSGLLLFHRGRFLGAAWATAVCAAQQPLFIPWQSALVVCHLRAAGWRSALRDWRLLGLVPVALSSVIFYQSLYGVPSLIGTTTTATGAIGLRKLYDLFFDLNSGLFLFYPGSLVILVLSAASLKRLRTALPLAFAVGMAILSTSTLNWNSGMAMIHRYSLLVAPPFALFLYLQLDEARTAGPRRRVALLLLPVLNAAVVVFFSLNPYTYLQFGPAATAALRYAPEFYNPYPETFVERAFGSEEFPWPTATFHFVDGHVWKMLATPSSLGSFSLTDVPTRRVSVTHRSFSHLSPRDFFYFTLRLDERRLDDFIARRCPPGRVTLVPFRPSFTTETYPQKGQFQIPVLVVNRTAEVLGGSERAVLDYHVRPVPGATIRFADTQSEPLPTIRPGESALVIQPVSGLEPGFYPFVTFDVATPTHGWLNAVVMTPPLEDERHRGP